MSVSRYGRGREVPHSHSNDRLVHAGDPTESLVNISAYQTKGKQGIEVYREPRSQFLYKHNTRFFQKSFVNSEKQAWENGSGVPNIFLLQLILLRFQDSSWLSGGGTEACDSSSNESSWGETDSDGSLHGSSDDDILAPSASLISVLRLNIYLFFKT